MGAKSFIPYIIIEDMPRKEGFTHIAISKESHKYLKKIAEIRKQSVYVVLDDFVKDIIVQLFDEQNNIK